MNQDCIYEENYIPHVGQCMLYTGASDGARGGVDEGELGGTRWIFSDGAHMVSRDLSGVCWSVYNIFLKVQ